MSLTANKIKEIKDVLSGIDGNIKLKAKGLEIDLLEKMIALLEKIEVNTRK